MKSGTLPPAKKSLGQCFLVDQSYARDIVDALHPAADDVIIEIGPGRGVLTQYLVETAAQIVAVEIDNRLIDPLREKFAKRSNFKLLHEDFLQTSLAAIVPAQRTVKVVGNLPYHLAAEVLYRLFEFARAQRGHSPQQWIQSAVLMMQKEVADRVKAMPDTADWGKLSVFAQLEARVDPLFVVPAGAFRPEPKVDGGVIQLSFWQLPPTYPVDMQLLERVVRWCFSQRRKKLRNSLAALPGVHPFWERADLDFNRRPETLTPAEWVALIGVIAAASGRSG